MKLEIAPWKKRERAKGKTFVQQWDEKDKADDPNGNAAIRKYLKAIDAMLAAFKRDYGMTFDEYLDKNNQHEKR